MAARPNANQMRVADFRLMARHFGIFPKLITCPNWLKDRYDALKPAKKMRMPEQIACLGLLSTLLS